MPHSLRFRNNFEGKLYLLSEQHRAALRNKLSEVRLIIIDEVSMLSSVLFFQFNQRLTETFRYSGKEPFAEPERLPGILCSNFYQLPPAKGWPVSSSATSIKDFLALDSWKKF